MSTAPHHDVDNDEDRNHGGDERARIENAATQLRVPVAGCGQARYPFAANGSQSGGCHSRTTGQQPHSPPESGSDIPVPPTT